MNENVALKLPVNEKVKHCEHNYSKHENGQFRKKHEQTTCDNCGRKRHISYYCSFRKNVSSIKRVWIPKGSHVLTNH